MNARRMLLALIPALLLAAPAAAAERPLERLAASCQSATSTDARSVAHRVCTAPVRSFDGTKLDVTLTLPAVAPRKPMPLVVFLHGFLADKGEYLSESAEGTGTDRGANAYKTVRWNNVWFASRGYAVLNYSARGHGGSGGDIELASRKFEVRDTRTLVGMLADDPALARIDPRRVGVLGSSYGGGQAWMLLTTREDDSLPYGSWRSPAGKVVRLAALVPQYTWSDLFDALVPNGHHLSDRALVPAEVSKPVGIGKQTLLDGFLASAGSRLSDEVVVWLARFNAGEPYDDPNDPVIPVARKALTEDRSPFYQEGFFAALRDRKQPRVPVLAAIGWTDPIFPPIEALRMYRRLRAVDSRYPIQLYLGDFEHLTALVKIGDLLHLHVMGNRLLDRNLKPKAKRKRKRKGRAGAARKKSLDVHAALSSCDPNRFGPVFKASDWDSLSRDSATFELKGPKLASSPASDPRGPTLDPVVASQQRGRGCITATSGPGPGIAFWEIDPGRELILLGLPRLELNFRTTASDVELNSRLWDLAPDGKRILVTRGAYRAVMPKLGGDRAIYELFGNAWRFEAGHRLVLELAPDDSTFLRRDNFAASITVDSAKLILPLAR